MSSHACPPSAFTMASSFSRACCAFFRAASSVACVCARIACGAISAIAASAIVASFPILIVSS